MKFFLLISLVWLIHTRDCQLACDDIKITYDKQSCYQNCDLKYTIGFTVGGIVLLSIAICLVCYCKVKKCQFIWIYKKRLYGQLNQIDPKNMKIEIFNQKVQKFNSCLNLATRNNVFSIFWEQSSFNMQVSSKNITFISQVDYLTKIRFKGINQFGKWSCEGFLLCKQGRFFIWFLLIFQDKDNLLRIGLHHLLLFQGFSERNSFQGDWITYAAQESKKGKWILYKNFQE